MNQECNFGVFFTCFTEVEAVDFSIGLLKQVYPACPVYLVSDGGADYSFLKSKYERVETKLEYDSRGISQRMSDEKWNTPGVREEIHRSVDTFFQRNLDAIEYCQKQSILIMEPDVLVRGKLNYFPDAKNALLGQRVNEGNCLEWDRMRQVLHTIPGHVDVTHWGATPAFYNTEVMKQVSDFTARNPEIVRGFIDGWHQFVCYDVFLAMLFGSCGYLEVFNPDIVEPTRNPNWLSTNKPLVHAFRSRYPKSNYSGRHAGEIYV